MIFDFDLNLNCNPNYLKFLGDEPETEKTDSRQDAKYVLSKVEGAAKFEKKIPWRLGAITFFSDVRIHASISRNPPSAPRE